MKQYTNPPCNSSLARSCIKSTIASSCDERKVAAPFTGGRSNSVEAELAIDETASTVSIAPNLCIVPDLSVPVREGEEGVQEFLDHLSGRETAASHFFGRRS